MVTADTQPRALYKYAEELETPWLKPCDLAFVAYHVSCSSTNPHSEPTPRSIRCTALGLGRVGNTLEGFEEVLKYVASARGQYLDFEALITEESRNALVALGHVIEFAVSAGGWAMFLRFTLSVRPSSYPFPRSHSVHFVGSPQVFFSSFFVYWEHPWMCKYVANK